MIRKNTQKRKLKKSYSRKRKIKRIPSPRLDIPVVCCLTNLSMRIDEQNRIPLFIYNNTGFPLGSPSSDPVYFIYQWRSISDDNLVQGYAKTPLRAFLPAGSSTKISMHVVAPYTAGDYMLEVMMSGSHSEPVCEIAVTITEEQMRTHAREYEIAVAEGRLDEAFTCYKKDQECLGNDFSENDTFLCIVSTVKEWCTANSLPYTIVQEARVQEEPSQRGFGSFYRQNIFGFGDVPEGYFAELRDVVIIGGYTLILADNNSRALYDAYLHPEKESIDFRQWDRIINDDATNTVLLTFEKDWGPDIEEGIFMDGVNAENYFHWLIEFIPRFWTLDQFDIDERIPLIVNAKLHPNLIEALEMCNSSRRPIICIHDGMRYRVKRLLVPSNLSFIPLDGKKGAETGSLGAIPPLAIQFLRQKFSHNMRKRDYGMGHLLYIHRKEALYRRPVNEKEVEETFVKYGFLSLNPAELSFSEQVALFSSARVIAGPGGAGLVNMIFAPNTTIILPLTATAYSFYSWFARYMDLETVNVTGKPIPGTSIVKHQRDYVIDVEKIEETIQSLDELSGMVSGNHPLNKPHQVSHICIDTLPVFPADTSYHIDRINWKIRSDYPSSIFIDGGQDLFIEGWAIDVIADAPAATVFISFDSGQQYRAFYSLKRPDVSAHFRNEKLLHCGFIAIIPANSLPHGIRKCSLKIVTHDRHHYYHYPDLITFNITQ